jgi:hypothetical protein
VNDAALRQFPDYLQVLVDVFRKLDPSTNEHLKNAFMITPALCVDFVDSILHAKDQVARAHKNPNREAYFTDDGFVMGIAAILAMLNQDILFDSLKFFKGVAVYFESAIVSSSSTPASSVNVNSFTVTGLDSPSGSGKDVDPASDTIIGLSKRRHRGAAREYELLMYALSGARVFFKRVADDTNASSKKPASMNDGNASEKREEIR